MLMQHRVLHSYDVAVIKHYTNADKIIKFWRMTIYSGSLSMYRCRV